MVGEIGPLLATVMATPILIHHIGTDRFGMLALAWTVFGYFGLFDLGLGSAVIKLVSDRLGAGCEEEVAPIFWTGLVLLAGFGLFGAAMLAIAAPALVHSLLRVPIALQPEALEAFGILATGLPLVISQSGALALLAAYQRFDRINLIRSPGAIFTSLGPLLVLPFSRSLAPLVGVLFIGQTATCVAYFVSCFTLVPSVRRRLDFCPVLVPKLVSFGSWVAAVNTVALVMHTCDRFVLAAMVSMNAVAFFMVPVRIIRKLHVMAGFVDTVLYPAFASSLRRDYARTEKLFDSGTKAVIILLFPVAVLLVMFSREALTLWIGANFARTSTSVLQWLMVAVLAEGVSQIAGSLAAAADRPDLSAKLYTLELPIYLAFVVFMIRLDGAEGAAIATAARAVANMFVQLAFLGWILPDLRWPLRRVTAAMAGCLLCLGAVAMPMAVAIKSVLAVVLFTALAPLAWFAFLDGSDRVFVRNSFRWACFLVPVSDSELTRHEDNSALHWTRTAADSIRARTEYQQATCFRDSSKAADSQPQSILSTRHDAPT
jgi:O-antigen/teichoic acid export membrane protein